MIKVAVVLTGFSFGKRNEKRVVNCNWNMAKESIKVNIIDSLKNQGYDVQIYLTTYFNDQLQEIVDFYNPKKVLLLDANGSKQRGTYIQSLSQLLTEDADLIVSTRFDIDFNYPLTSFNLNLDKINFFAKLAKLRYWIDHKYIDDNIFVFPKKYLNNFIEGIRVIDSAHHTDAHLHPMYEPMVKIVGKENINFMIDEYNTATQVKYYKLMRVCNCSLSKSYCDCWQDVFKWQTETEVE